MIPSKLTDPELWAFMDRKPTPSTPSRGLVAAVPFGLAFWALLIWRLKS